MTGLEMSLQYKQDENHWRFQKSLTLIVSRGYTPKCSITPAIDPLNVLTRVVGRTCDHMLMEGEALLSFFPVEEAVVDWRSSSCLILLACHHCY